jgi:hypothetical protein
MTCEQLYDLAGGLPDLMSEGEGKAKVNTLLGLGTCQPPWVREISGVAPCVL